MCAPIEYNFSRLIRRPSHVWCGPLLLLLLLSGLQVFDRRGGQLGIRFWGIRRGSHAGKNESLSHQEMQRKRNVGFVTENMPHVCMCVCFLFFRWAFALILRLVQIVSTTEWMNLSLLVTTAVPAIGCIPEQ